MRLWQSSKRLAGSGALVPAFSLVAVLALVGGCETKGFLDPSEMGRYGKNPQVVPILRNLDTGVEERDEQFATATDVRQADLVATATDYAIGAGDLIQVSITDLFQQGVETQKVSRVTESGYISLPLIGQVKATGLTEAQLEQAIIAAYRDANQIPNAQISVVTVEARARTFSVLGAVGQPGQYAILESNTRMLDALVLARGVTDPVGIEYAYVVRRKEHDVQETPPADQMQPQEQPQPGATPDVLTPRSAVPQNPKMMMDSPEMQPAAPAAEAPAAEPAAEGGTAEGRIIVVDDQPMQIEGGQAVPTDGQQPAAEVAAEPEAAAKEFEFNELTEPQDVRVIRVPIEQLRRGDLRYNIVIRPQDMIIVPNPMIGEYYMGGHVQRVGVYSLTARNVTLRQAVISAGMLDQLAIPSRTEIVRRVSPTKQVFARVDLAKIFAGEEPDVLLKPDDQVMVGTNAIAPFVAAIRNGFRVTYGFGFLYDRNYWDPDTN